MKQLSAFITLLLASLCIWPSHSQLGGKQLGGNDPEGISVIQIQRGFSQQDPVGVTDDDELVRKRRQEEPANGSLSEDDIPNWMNSFLNGVITIPDKSGQDVEYNMIFDASNRLAGGGNFLVGTCPKNKKDPATNKTLSCQRHSMHIFSQAPGTKCLPPFEQTAYDGKTVMNAKVCLAQPVKVGRESAPMDTLVLDGDHFHMFDLMLDSGAFGASRLDGIFSMVFTTPETDTPPNAPKGYRLQSGMEQLLANKTRKIASVFMEPFIDLNFQQKSGGAITVGKEDTRNCKNWSYQNVVTDAERWRVGMDVEIKWPVGQKAEKKPNQQVIISTTDIFIFAPRSVTQQLLSKVRRVKDHLIFKFGRNVLNKPGLSPKDVMVHCPTEKEYASLPTLQFNIGAQTFTFKPKEYVLPLKLNIPRSNKKVGVFNWCHMMLREVPADDAMFAKDVMGVTAENNKDLWMFGQLFYNKACVAFDYTPGNLKVGVATANGQKISN